MGQRLRQEGRRQINRAEQRGQERPGPKDRQESREIVRGETSGKKIVGQKGVEKVACQSLGQKESPEPLIRCVCQASRP
ncbi:MAG TPA: hypothetical protein VJ783_10165 [Pirellulales bacterium]|nr:hypothetical protein [Pirellulales bacterium]